MRYIIFEHNKETNEDNVLCMGKNYPERRYIRSYPLFDSNICKIVKCKTIHEAVMERDGLQRYCGRKFEIREFAKNKLGKVVEDD